jgi:putative sterol carrier protein
MNLSPATKANIELMKAWLDAHNRQDMKALDYMSHDVEIVETPTGVAWRGRKDMENLAKLAYSRKSFKELTHIFATDDEACVEYITKVSTAGEVNDFEKQLGLHGLDVSNAKPTVDMFELKVCFVCRIKDGKIDNAREYWDAASMAQQLGVDKDEPQATTPAAAGLTPKVILEEMVLENAKNQLETLSKIHAICQFDISGQNGGQWYLNLTKPGGQVVRGTSPNASCTISMSDEDFVAFFNGSLSSQKAFITGKLKIKGDMGSASALRDILKLSPSTRAPDPRQRAPGPWWWESARFQAVCVALSGLRQSSVISSHPPAGNAHR